MLWVSQSDVVSAVTRYMTTQLLEWGYFVPGSQVLTPNVTANTSVMMQSTAPGTPRDSEISLEVDSVALRLMQLKTLRVTIPEAHRMPAANADTHELAPLAAAALEFKSTATVRSV